MKREPKNSQTARIRDDTLALLYTNTGRREIDRGNLPPVRESGCVRTYFESWEDGSVLAMCPEIYPDVKKPYKLYRYIRIFLLAIVLLHCRLLLLPRENRLRAFLKCDDYARARASSSCERENNVEVLKFNLTWFDKVASIILALEKC